MSEATPDGWHWLFSGIEVASIILLLIFQGVLRPGNCWAGLLQLTSRLCHRIKSCPRKQQIPSVSGIVLVGSGLLAAIGFLTGFFPASFQAPSTILEAFAKLLATFFMPGLVEEIVFRGVLIRAPSDKCMSASPKLQDKVRTNLDKDRCKEGNGSVVKQKDLKLESASKIGITVDDNESESQSQPAQHQSHVASPIGLNTSGPCSDGSSARDVDYSSVEAINDRVVEQEDLTLQPATKPGITADDRESEARGHSAQHQCHDASPIESEKSGPCGDGSSAKDADYSSVDRTASAESAEEVRKTSRAPFGEQLAYLAIFLIYHLDAIHAQSFFRDYRFFLLAAVIGLCCQESCIRTQSLWPSVIMHWLWVWVWITFLFNQDFE